MNEGCPTREVHKGSTDAEKQGPQAAARHSRKLSRGSYVYQVSKEGLGGWARWEGVAQAPGAALQRRGSVNRHVDVCACTHAEIESGVVQYGGYTAGQRSAEPHKLLHGSWRPLSLFRPEEQGFPTLIFSSEPPGEHFDIFLGPTPRDF